ncbi:MAG: alanine racemase [Lentisphaerae bacterium]|jgi:alanine racemase|nr:alanine racemase [Lentisphaerota bacterium]
MHKVSRRVVLDINLSILAENFRKISEVVAPLRSIAVLKADAYGLGMPEIAKTLVDSGLAAIAVAEIKEAIDALKFNVPVIILGAILPEEIEPAILFGVRIPVAGWEEALKINDIALKLNKKAVCHLAVDTGMGRLGIRHESAFDIITRISGLQGLQLEGMYSHFPAASHPDDPETQKQIDIFRNLNSQLIASGLAISQLHMANSDAICNWKSSCMEPFTHVRPGISLYGFLDASSNNNLDLQPVLTVHSHLAQVRMLPAGSTIGYERTYKCEKPALVGTVAAGYAEGMPLALSNRGHVIIRGCPCPVLGKVSMDYTTVALDNVPGAAVGDEVICIGGDAPNNITVEDWASLKGTHQHDILCSFGNRVERRYV